MKRVWQRSAIVLAGLLLTAVYALPQAYTVSAKPGALNYIEGHAYLDGRPLSDKGLRETFLNANDTLSTDDGKAEVLLTPGVFLRIGDNSQIRMISPSLVNAQIEVSRGEAIIEAAGLVKDTNIEVIDHGASITIEKNGLYRFTGGDAPAVAVLDGKAEVYFGEEKIDLNKDHETLLGANLKSRKFDAKKEDDLYAWSNVRSEYDAAASYQAARNVSTTNYGGWGGYGYGGWSGPGWFWDNAFDSWAWLPASGAFYSPFGYGFYSPGAVIYAPVVTGSVYRGGRWNHDHDGDGHRGGRWNGTGTTTAPVPVNPNRPPAIGGIARSPFENRVARSEAAQSFANSGGFRTAAGAPAATFSGSRMTGFTGGAGHAGWSGSAGAAGRTGGWSGGGAAAAHSSGFSGGGGGGHFSGGSSGGGGGHASSGGGGGHR